VQEDDQRRMRIALGIEKKDELLPNQRFSNQEIQLLSLQIKNLENVQEQGYESENEASKSQAKKGLGFDVDQKQVEIEAQKNLLTLRQGSGEPIVKMPAATSKLEDSSSDDRKERKKKYVKDTRSLASAKIAKGKSSKYSNRDAAKKGRSGPGPGKLSPSKRPSYSDKKRRND